MQDGNLLGRYEKLEKNNFFLEKNKRKMNVNRSDTVYKTVAYGKAYEHLKLYQGFFNFGSGKKDLFSESIVVCFH